MTFYYNVNQAPAKNTNAIFSLKELMKTVGWIVKSSGDGLTYNPSGDIFTSGDAGAGGMFNTSSWFRIQMPLMGGVNRELIFQYGSSFSWRIKYSYSTGFTGGSPSATRTPAATDEKYIMGGATDASPQYSPLFAGDASYKYHAVVADINDGFMFYSVAAGHNSGNLTHILYMDQMQIDSISSLDIDGYVFYANYTPATLVARSLYGHGYLPTANNGPQSWLKKGFSNETFVTTPVCAYYTANSGGAGVIANSAIGINSFDGKDIGLPAIYARLSAEPGASSGFKGIGRLFKLASSNRSNGTPLDFISIRDRIQFDVHIFPWNGTIPLI